MVPTPEESAEEEDDEDDGNGERSTSAATGSAQPSTPPQPALDNGTASPEQVWACCHHPPLPQRRHVRELQPHTQYRHYPKP